MASLLTLPAAAASAAAASSSAAASSGAASSSAAAGAEVDCRSSARAAASCAAAQAACAPSYRGSSPVISERLDGGTMIFSTTGGLGGVVAGGDVATLAPASFSSGIVSEARSTRSSAGAVPVCSVVAGGVVVGVVVAGTEGTANTASSSVTVALRGGRGPAAAAAAAAADAEAPTAGALRRAPGVGATGLAAGGSFIESGKLSGGECRG